MKKYVIVKPGSKFAFGPFDSYDDASGCYASSCDFVLGRAEIRECLPAPGPFVLNPLALSLMLEEDSDSKQGP